MADGVRLEARDDDAEQAALGDEARLIRRVRWRLVAWSGVSTLVVLLVLGATLYAVTASTLAGASITQLDNRVEPGVAREGMPDPGGLAAARDAEDGRDVRTVDVRLGSSTFPARLLTQRATYVQDGKTYFLQALQDRSTEVATLQSLLVTLLVGGMVVVVVAFAFGAAYASRALVPIRQSLEAQRVALRRQREFAADASHELRTPLTVIRSSVEHLQRHRDEPVAQSGEALEDIDAEVTHLTTLVDDLLLLARSDSGAVALDAVPLDLGDIAFDAAGSL